MRLRPGLIAATLGLYFVTRAFAEAPDPAAVERGRVALTTRGYLTPAWKLDAYRAAGGIWGEPARDPATYDEAFRRYYGLHTPPYPNDGLPMGLRRAKSPDGSRVGIQIDCMVCHGGSIGGVSYVGLGNSTLDLQSLLSDLSRADGQPPAPSLFTLNTARGTVNAGSISSLLLSFRNPDLSRRTFPLLLGANLPEMDTPAWWHLGRKATMYYDGRTSADSVRTNMQFLLGELSAQEFKDLEPTFRDIQAYLKSLKAPRYPFPIDRERAERGSAVFAKSCTKCHGTYGPDGEYPSRVVELDVIGTDPARALGMSDRLIAHYNRTWFAENHPADKEMVGYQAPPLDGVWATAPYLHNGSVPTLAALLNSPTRPARFRRPPSTDFEHYDRAAVGWKFKPLETPPDPTLPAHEARFIFDTARFGLGNGGHTFGDKLSDDDRADLIEYLKTL